MYKLEKFEKYQDLSEIFQDLDLKFAFVNKKKQVSMPAKCRDFLGDCIWSKATGKKALIYGFEYDFKKTPYDLKQTVLSIKFPNKNLQKNFNKNLAFLHEKEQKAGVKLTKVLQTQEKDTVVVIGSNHWMHHPWKIALYTFYLKLMTLSDPNVVITNPEKGYSNQIKPVEDKLLSNVKYKHKYDTFDGIYDQHNYTGVISLIKNQNTYLKMKDLK